jgi:hypothetical protein
VADAGTGGGAVGDGLAVIESPRSRPHDPRWGKSRRRRGRHPTHYACNIMTVGCEGRQTTRLMVGERHLHGGVGPGRQPRPVPVPELSAANGWRSRESAGHCSLLLSNIRICRATS